MANMDRQRKKQGNTFNAEAHHRQLAEQHGDVVREVQALVDRITTIVCAHAPLDLLAKCHLYMGGVRAGKFLESAAETDDMVALRLPEYVQSIIVSAQPMGNAEITGTIFKELVELVEKLYVKLTLEYAVTSTAVRRQEMEKFSQPLDSLRIQQHMRWLAVRGQRYLQHDFQFLRQFLYGHSAVFEGVFAVTAEDIVLGIEKLNEALSGAALNNGTPALHEEWQTRYMAAVDEIRRRHAAGYGGPYPTPKELAKQISGEVGFDPTPDRQLLTTRATSGEPFDVVAITGLPEALVSRLALTPGEDPTFFSGDHPGWPSQQLPIMSRPFLKLGGRYYAFETATFFDYIFHNLREAVTRGDQKREQRWEKQQKEDTEQAALDILEELLPGAARQATYFYEYLDEKSGEMRFAEADGYLLYARHLLLVEVKGGRASHRAPTGNLASYLKGIGKLTADPVAQAERFLKELARTGEVVLRDEHRSVIGKLGMADFDRAHVIAVTLDYVSDVTANVQGQEVLRVGQGYPTWIVNFADLWITRDLIPNPVQFLHFLDQRAEAQAVPVLQMNDEIHHLALYFRENRYAERYARETRPDRISFHGLTDDFDAHYHGLPDAAKPGQNLPPLFGEMVAALSRPDLPEHVRAGKYLLDLPLDIRIGLEKRLQHLMQQQLGAVTAVSTRGRRPITISVRPTRANDEVELRKHTLGVMQATGDTERLLLCVTLDDTVHVAEVVPAFLTQADVAMAEPEELNQITMGLTGTFVLDGRVGKISRNAPCPCGSGQKYKRCCGSQI
jgi:SEC-C motif